MSRVLVGGIAAATVLLGAAFVTGVLVGRGPGTSHRDSTYSGHLSS